MLSYLFGKDKASNAANPTAAVPVAPVASTMPANPSNSNPAREVRIVKGVDTPRPSTASRFAIVDTRFSDLAHQTARRLAVNLSEQSKDEIKRTEDAKRTLFDERNKYTKIIAAILEDSSQIFSENDGRITSYARSAIKSLASNVRPEYAGQYITTYVENSTITDIFKHFPTKSLIPHYNVLDAKDEDGLRRLQAILGKADKRSSKEEGASSENYSSDHESMSIYSLLLLDTMFSLEEKRKIERNITQLEENIKLKLKADEGKIKADLDAKLVEIEESKTTEIAQTEESYRKEIAKLNAAKENITKTHSDAKPSTFSTHKQTIQRLLEIHGITFKSKHKVENLDAYCQEVLEKIANLQIDAAGQIRQNLNELKSQIEDIDKTYKSNIEEIERIRSEKNKTLEEDKARHNKEAQEALEATNAQADSSLRAVEALKKETEKLREGLVYSVNSRVNFHIVRNMAVVNSVFNRPYKIQIPGEYSELTNTFFTWLLDNASNHEDVKQKENFLAWAQAFDSITTGWHVLPEKQRARLLSLLKEENIAVPDFNDTGRTGSNVVPLAPVQANAGAANDNQSVLTSIGKGQ